jgi:hypothetical protein
MKKAFFAFMSGVLLSPLLVGAVTWSVDSSPFSFPTVSTVMGPQALISQTAFKSTYDAGHGIVAFRFNLSSVTKNATLNIFNHNGVRVRSFDVSQGTSAVQWNISRNNIAAGIYLASLRSGTVEKSIQISIVK